MPMTHVSDRRAHLVQSALDVLSEVGYANTSVRDIGHRSSYSHGVLHYYFKDKSTLILEAIRLFKTRCIAAYDEALAGVRTADELLAVFAAELTHSIEVDGAMHRLWYDVRAQGYFGTVDSAEVTEMDAQLEAMVLRYLTTYAALADLRLLVDAPTAYGLVDGLFQRALQDHFAGDEGAAAALVTRLNTALPRLFG